MNFYISPMQDRDTRPSNRTGWLWIILLTALILRVAYLISYADSPLWEQLTVDNNYHHHWAIDIAGGNLFGDTTYFRAPLYVYCLALLYAVLGTSLWVGRLFGLATGLASIAMTYVLGKRIHSARTGLVAAALHAVYPLTIYFESELLLDPLFLLLLQIAVHRLLVWMDRCHPRDLILFGLFTGLAAITRPTALLLLLPAAVIVYQRYRHLAPTTAGALLVLGGLLLPIGPIFVRNIAVAGDPVLIASQAGINLYIGNNDEADGVSARLPEPLGHNWRLADIAYIAEQERDSELKPGEISTYWTGRAAAWIAANPGNFLALYGSKLYRSVANREISNNRSLSTFFDRFSLLRYNPLGFGLIFALSLIGIVGFYRSSLSVRLVVYWLALYLLAISLFFFSSRFRLPLMPWFFILAALGLGSLLTAIRQRSRTVILPVATGLIGGFISFYPLIPLPAGSSPQAAVMAANYAYAAGDYETALHHGLRAAEIDSTFPEVNLVVGNAYLRLGNTDAAADYYSRELRRHPERSKAYTNAASLELVTGNPRPAVNLAREAVRLRPYDTDANRVLLRALFTAEPSDTTRLIEEISAAAVRTDRDIYVLNEAAVLLSELQLYPAAEEVLQAALKTTAPPIETDDAAFDHVHIYSDSHMHRQRARAAYQLGYLNGLRGRFELARNYSRRAVELDPDLTEAWINLINAHLFADPPLLGAADSLLTEAEQRFGSSDPLRALRTAYNRLRQ